MKTQNNTLQNIMDIGQKLVQERGYNGFSYADIAEAIGIRKASIHYHFPSKKDLVQAVVLRYRKDFMERLHKIDFQSQDTNEKINGFFGMYRETLENKNKLCLCTMMAAEINSFPEEIRNQINLFFSENESWVEKVLEKGKELGQISSTNVAKQAKVLVAYVQGAQLISRSSGSIEYFDSLVEHFSF
ncbi:TetR/AcrR family transcriptional regulator [Bacillus sp. OTU2372]|uniref:TetR/AcrR family transcriptional regulator n=1 Tax=Bacillus sp. OTU2372 TaxID=3043858 RepID=UPI00313B41B4